MSSIKYEVESILRYQFVGYDIEDEDIKVAATKICDKVEDGLMSSIRIAIQANIHGMPG